MGYVDIIRDDRQVFTDSNNSHFNNFARKSYRLRDFIRKGSYVGEVVKAMDKKKVLVKVHPEGKFVVDVDKNIDINDVTPNCRVALRNDSYTLHKILPNKVDPLVGLLHSYFFEITTYLR